MSSRIIRYLPYSDENNDGLIDNIGRSVGEKTLVMYTLSDESQSWQKVEDCWVEVTENLVRGRIWHTSIYGLMAQAPAENLDNMIVYPNPYHPGSGGSQDAPYIIFKYLTDSTKIRIFTVAGDFVKEITNTGYDNFEEWPAENDAGRPVASGVYIYYAFDEDNHRKTGKLVIIR